LKSPVLWLLAGGNGAGKSTFYHQYLASSGIPFINADEIAKRAFRGEEETRSYDAAIMAAMERDRLLAEHQSFCFETVFSHASKVDFVAEAKAAGYFINLVFIHLDNSDLNVARVHSRVHDGGHTVPEDKIRQRIPRTIDNIRRVIPLCDRVLLLDNASLESPYRRIAGKREDGTWSQAAEGPLPDWAEQIIR
jgi:predicted ABC-type ATPase